MEAFNLGVGIAKALKQHGVSKVFGIPGVHNVELYRGLESTGITHILARHEQGAGFMADGYARATGNPGVAFVISGPGLTNILTPVGQAYSDSVPMLVISSCLPEIAQVPGQLHEMRDQTGAAATVCDWSKTASDGAEVFDLLNRAFAEFSGRRARPKHISVPIDVLSGPCPDIPAPVAGPDLPTAGTQEIEQIANMLAAATKPLFIFGGGAAGAVKSANDIVRKTQAAVISTYSGRGVIDPDYPLLFGAILPRPSSETILQQADLIVAVGTELAQVDLWRDTPGHQAEMIRVDIDPLVLADQHQAETGLLGDAKSTLEALAGVIEQSTSDWSKDAVIEARAVARADACAQHPEIVPYIEKMRTVLPDDALIFSDMTQFAYLAKEIYPLSQPNCWQHPFGFGTLGYGMPAAIGAKIGCPHRDVVAIAGDSGFQYTAEQLGVAAELSLCLPIIIWDNGRLSAIEEAMIEVQIAPTAVVAQNPDFGLLAQAYGVAYERPLTPGDFGPVLRKALKSNQPTIIHLSPNRER